jgi:hypothetical protein
MDAKFIGSLIRILRMVRVATSKTKTSADQTVATICQDALRGAAVELRPKVGDSMKGLGGVSWGRIVGLLDRAAEIRRRTETARVRARTVYSRPVP